MRSRSVMLLGLALGCGLVASIGISQVMERRNQGEAPAGEMEPILVAATDLNYNDLLTPDKIRFEEWPKGKVPPGAVTNLEEVKDRRSSTKLFAGEPILTGKLMGSDGSGAARKIPKGYRMVSVAVDAVTGASSLIKPDDKVDVLLYMQRRPELGIEESTTKTILQGVRVFAVDKVFERAHGDEKAQETAKTVALLVTPEQAQRITHANGMGTIRLVLRSPEDDDQSETNATSVTDILGTTPGAPSNFNDQSQPGAALGLSAPPHQATAATTTPAPAPAPISAQTAPPSHWTMVLLEGSQMRQVELSTSEQFPVITSEHIDYEPDPPVQTPPAEPAVDADAADPDTSNSPTLIEPTVGDDGFGSPTEVPNN